MSVKFDLFKIIMKIKRGLGKCTYTALATPSQIHSKLIINIFSEIFPENKMGEREPSDTNALLPPPQTILSSIFPLAEPPEFSNSP